MCENVTVFLYIFYIAIAGGLRNAAKRRSMDRAGSESFSAWLRGHELDTPPKFNIAPDKWWLEAYFPIGKVIFQGLC